MILKNRGSELLMSDKLSRELLKGIVMKLGSDQIKADISVADGEGT
jgi:hypothetical protein